MKLQAYGISRTFYRKGRNTNFFNAVERTDFILEEGSVTGIIGRSGSGKTTFSNMLCGLLTPSEGKVLLGNQDFYELDDKERSLLRNRHIGIIPQGNTGLQNLTVLENVLLPAAMYGDAEAKKEDALNLLEAVGISELYEVYSNELSGGELRRMSIARALINSPDIIVADEPTGDLDDDTTGFVLKLLRQYADHGASVLMVTHEKEALLYTDNVYRMDKGVLHNTNTC